MQDDIERRLERRASRGEARGAEAVWSATRAAADVAPRRRSIAVPAAAMVAACAAVVSVIAVTVDDEIDPPAASPHASEPSLVIAQNASSLVLFDGCAEVLAELKEEALERVGPYGLDGGRDFLYQRRDVFLTREAGVPVIQSTGHKAAAGATPDSSATNTQEEGVDEPDLVETDGRRLFDVRGGTLRVVDIEAADVIATVPLSLVNVDGAVLVGDVLVVFANEPLSSLVGGEAKIVLVDVSGSPVVRERLTIDGTVVDARVVEGRVHVVTVSPPTVAFTYPDDPGDATAEEAAKEANKERVRSSTLADWLPAWTINAADGSVVQDRSQLTECDQIRRPRAFAGFDQTSLLTLDLEAPADSASTSVQASSLLVYGSEDSLYTATTEYDGGPLDPAASNVSRDRPKGPHTDIHRFALGATPTYAGSGDVDGYVREQFGLSEHQGHLRVASSTFTGAAESRVTVLRIDEGELVETGVVDGLGPDEEIQGVRFIGDLGYVVTFQRTDPLYVVDLRDPSAPRLAGELKIPGYSRYLHPVGDGLLMGVGYDGTDQGQLTGAAVSLFDVTDPAAPTRVDLEAFGGPTAPLLDDDHHAFTWWSDTATAYIPVSVTGTGNRVEVVRVEGGALSSTGEVLPAGDGAPRKAAFDRTVIAGERLLSISPEGVQVNDRETLAPIAWIPYR